MYECASCAVAGSHLHPSQLAGERTRPPEEFEPTRSCLEGPLRHEQLRLEILSLDGIAFAVSNKTVDFGITALAI